MNLSVLLNVTANQEVGWGLLSSRGRRTGTSEEGSKGHRKGRSKSEATREEASGAGGGMLIWVEKATKSSYRTAEGGSWLESPGGAGVTLQIACCSDSSTFVPDAH